MNRLHEIIQNAFGTFTFAVAVVLTVLGTLCLMSGRKFYWVAVGICGFLMSYVSIRGMINWSDWQEFALAGFIGMIAMLLAFLFKKFAIAITCFFVFGLMIAAFINEQVQFADDSFVPLILFFIVGSGAAFFSFNKMEVCIRLLSSVMGAVALSVGIFKFTNSSPNALTIFLVWIAISVAAFALQQSRIKNPYEDEEAILEKDN
ncbi:MAG: DUF4203 domain-containing protein [Chitinophagaceae bacterium]